MNDTTTPGRTDEQALASMSGALLDNARTGRTEARSALAALNEALRAATFGPEDLRATPSWMDTLLGRPAPLVRLAQRFETLRARVDAAQDGLLAQAAALDKAIASTQAIERRLREGLAGIDAAIAQEQGQVAPTATEPTNEGIRAHEAIAAARGTQAQAKRRLHDLALTRQVTLQTLASAGLMRTQDEGLRDSVLTTLAVAVPAWDVLMSHIFALGGFARAPDASPAAATAAQHALHAALQQPTPHASGTPQ